MKKLVLILALSATAIAAVADTNYMSHGSNDSVPVGASGQGVTQTIRAMGRVIAIGNPLYRMVPVGNSCHNPQPSYQVPPQPQSYHYQQQQQAPAQINPGTVLGGLVGGSIGSLAGKGRGREIMIVGGALAGAMIGTDAYNEGRREHNPGQVSGPQRCETVYENRVIGYPYVVQYNNIQMRGTSRSPVNIGDELEVIVRSTFYPGN
jgi:uncharacterized protein YcfJ